MRNSELKENRKQHRTLREKYANLEEKLNPICSEELAEILESKGSYADYNPLIIRPYNLVRYVVENMLKRSEGANNPLVKLILRGTVKYGAKYTDYSGYDDECTNNSIYTGRQLKAGLKVIFRHIKYGPTEIDKVCCLDEWSRYFKNYSSHRIKDLDIDSEIMDLLENNLELKKYFETIDSYDEMDDELNHQEIFDKVSENLARVTFRHMNIGEVKKYDVKHIIGDVLQETLDVPYYPIAKISEALFIELWHFLPCSRFYSFEEFKEEGIPKFFNTWLAEYKDVIREVYKKYANRWAERERCIAEKKKKCKGYFEMVETLKAKRSGTVRIPTVNEYFAEKKEKEERKRIEKEKQNRTLVAKYVNLERKFNSGFRSEMDEVLLSKGYSVEVNPMLYRPYNLIRYMVSKGLEMARTSEHPYSFAELPFLDLIERGIVKCGAEYNDRNYQLKAGMKVIFRHMKYGSSELDKVYCLEPWSRYFKKYYHELMDDPEIDFEIRDVLKKIFGFKLAIDDFGQDGWMGSGSYDDAPQEIFNRVSETLARYTCGIIQSRRVTEPGDLGRLQRALREIQITGTSGKSIGHDMYFEVYNFIATKRYDFIEFKEDGIREFFSTQLLPYEDAAFKIIEEHEKRMKARVKMQKDHAKMQKDHPKERETFKPTSMF